MTPSLLISLVSITALILLICGLLIGDYRREDDEL